MAKYPIGYKVHIFWRGDKTTYKYVGNGEWECVSGDDCPARYEQLLDFIGER